MIDIYLNFINSNFIYLALNYINIKKLSMKIKKTALFKGLNCKFFILDRFIKTTTNNITIVKNIAIILSNLLSINLNIA